MDEYKRKEQEFIESSDKTKSMMSTYIRKVTFRSETVQFPVDYSIVVEDMENICIEVKKQEDTVVTKECFPITMEQANEILDGNYDCLSIFDEQSIKDFYHALTNDHLVPTYRKEFTRKTFHQNKYLDIIFDISMSRKPYTENDLFAPRGFVFKSDYGNLRMEIRHNLGISDPMEQLLAFERELALSQQ